MVRVGLVGCGTIGSQLAGVIDRRYRRVARVVALNDCVPQQAARLQRRLRSRPSICSLPQLIRTSRVVIEAASADVAGEVVTRALRAHRDVVVMSVGGLLRDFSWARAARRSRGRLHIPSGALAGIDGIRAMALGKIRRVRLITRKPPRALVGAPYVRKRGLRLEHLTQPSIVFEGTARRVVQAFPQNTNVAAALALAAGVSPSRTQVRVIADPTIRTNIHEIEVEGDCGRLRCQVQSEPSANPKTSELAVRSSIATLQRLFEPVAIGT